MLLLYAFVNQFFCSFYITMTKDKLELQTWVNQPYTISVFVLLISGCHYVPMFPTAHWHCFSLCLCSSTVTTQSLVLTPWVAIKATVHPIALGLATLPFQTDPQPFHLTYVDLYLHPVITMRHTFTIPSYYTDIRTRYLSPPSNTQTSGRLALTPS